MASTPPEHLVAAALRRAGLAPDVVEPQALRFPQTTRSSSSVGKTIATSRSLTALEIPVAQALPGARRVITVGKESNCPQGRFYCRIQKNALVAGIASKEAESALLSCVPPRSSLKIGARVPAWWFSAYEELGGGSPWHDGFDDNGTYYWTLDLLKNQGKGAKVVPMGFSRNGGTEFGDHPLRPAFRSLLETSGLLDVTALLIYWRLLPCEKGRSVVVADLHLPIGLEELKASLDGIAPGLARAKRVFDRSRNFVVLWKYTQRRRILMY
jgi:hypothetical protein